MTLHPTHLLRLLTNGYSDGRYLNNSPVIAEYLQTEGKDLCYVEIIDTYNHVRIWSSLDAYTQDKKSRISVGREQPHPLVLAMRLAIREQDFDRVMEIKKQMKEEGVVIT